MKRRKFIEKSILGLITIYISTNFIACNNIKKLQLNQILDEFSSIIKYYNQKIGEKGFICYVLKPSEFSVENNNNLEEAFIYCEEEKINGFTIRYQDVGQLSEMLEDLNTLHNKYKLTHENEFGKEFEWETSNKRIKLSYNEGYNLKKNIFYGEFTLKNNLIF